MQKLKFSKTTKKSEIDDKNAEVEEIRKQLSSANKEIAGRLHWGPVEGTMGVGDFLSHKKRN